MRDWTKPAATLLLGTALLIFCLCFYLSHLPVSYTYDGMVFADRVENAKITNWQLFHPHHLLYTFFGRMFFRWGLAHGATWDGLVALQFFNILTGCLGALVMFHLLVRETGNRPAAFLTAAGLCVTFSYWYFSTSPGVRILATVTPLLVWYLLSYFKAAPPAFGLVLGLAHAFSVLGHQTNLLLVPAFLGGIWCLARKTQWEKIRASFYYLVALVGGILAVYGFVGRFLCLRDTYEKWVWWVFSYFHVPGWGGNLPADALEEGKLAMMQAFLKKTFFYRTMSVPITYGEAQDIFQAALLVLLIVLVVRFKPLWAAHRPLLAVGFLWLLAFVPFFLWWEPWNIEFWVSSTVPCWIMAGVLVSDMTRWWKNPVIRFAQFGAVIALFASLAFLLFLYNFSVHLVKEQKPVSYHKTLLEALDWKIKTSDLLVITGVNNVPFFIERYHKRDYVKMHSFLLKHRRDARAAALAARGKPKESGRRKTSAWEELSGLFNRYWEKNRKVWVLAEVVDEDDPWKAKFEKAAKLPRGRLDKFFREYVLSPVSYRRKVYYYEIVKPNPTPTPVVTPPPGRTPVPEREVKKPRKGTSR